MHRRSFLAGLAATALTSATSATAYEAGSEMTLPQNGVKASFGFRTQAGLLVKLKDDLNVPADFYSQSLFYFPAQAPATVTTGYRQSSAGVALRTLSNLRSDGTRQILEFEYRDTLRDGLGGEYGLEGEPLSLQGRPAKLELQCSFNSDRRDFLATEDLDALTPQELAIIEARINSGAAKLINPPSVFEKNYVYGLPTGETMVVLFDHSVWPHSGIKTLIGNGNNWREVAAEYSSPDDVHSDFGTGVNTSEGFLKYDPSPVETTWYSRSGTTLTTVGPAQYIGSLENSPHIQLGLSQSDVADVIRPKMIPNPCASLNMA